MSTQTPSLSTLEDVLRRVPLLHEASKQARLNMASAIKRFSNVVERDPASIPANGNALRVLFETASPGTLGLSSRRWANIKSEIRRAVALGGFIDQEPTIAVPLTNTWEKLCLRGPTATLCSLLRRLGRFCCSKQLRPDQVSDLVIREFLDHLQFIEISKAPDRILGDTIRAWNRYIASDNIPSLTRPSRSRAYTFQWSDFPASLKADVDAYHDSCLHPDPLDPDAPRAVKPSTVEQQDRCLRRLASVEVILGVDAVDLVDLTALLQPDKVKPALRYFMDRREEKTGGQAYDMAYLAAKIAKHWAKLSSEDVDRLRLWSKRLKKETNGLTEKNQHRLRQFRDKDVLKRLYQLPAEVFARERKKPVESRSALRIQSALAIALLSVAPMRIGNLRILDWKEHFQSAFSQKDPQLQIRIKAKDVKNDKELTFPVPDDIETMLEVYMATYQPHLANGHASTLIFPGRTDAPKQISGLRRNICDLIRKEIGLDVNPHLFRHISALVFLERYPGHYEEVRRILGHKSIQTTLNSYAGLETTAALQRFDTVVLDLKKSPRRP